MRALPLLVLNDDDDDNDGYVVRTSENDNFRRDVPSEIFSPASGGRAKVRRAMLEMSAHGIMRLNT